MHLAYLLFRVVLALAAFTLAATVFLQHGS